MSRDDSMPELIIPNVKSRFSGITSTILQVLPQQAKQMKIVSVGKPLPEEIVPHISWKELRKLAKRTRPDGVPMIFHCRRNDDMIIAWYLKKLLRKKLHLVFTSVAQREHSLFTRFLYRRMDTLLSTSDRSASFLKRKPDAIIPHGTDIERYYPSMDRDAEWKEGGLPGKYGIGIFGRVRAQKGLGEFVESLCRVLPKYPDFTAVIIGEILPKHQSFVDELKAKIRDQGLEDRFAWLGKLPFEALPAWFRRMSLVAAVSRVEGFGLTCLEAMSSGAPVVATRTGGFEMVIREGIDGRLIPVKDADALERAFDELLRDPRELHKMGKAARERIEDAFTIEREASALIEVYRGIQDSYVSA